MKQREITRVSVEILWVTSNKKTQLLLDEAKEKAYFMDSQNWTVHVRSCLLKELCFSHKHFWVPPSSSSSSRQALIFDSTGWFLVTSGSYLYKPKFNKKKICFSSRSNSSTRTEFHFTLIGPLLITCTCLWPREYTVHIGSTQGTCFTPFIGLGLQSVSKEARALRIGKGNHQSKRVSSRRVCM